MEKFTKKNFNKISQINSSSLIQNTMKAQITKTLQYKNNPCNKSMCTDLKIPKENLQNNSLNYSISRLQRDFFSTDAVTLARGLLGKIIVRILCNQMIKCRIVETEAYMGESDRGSHVSKSGKTERTKAFWTSGGHLYIYLIYGINNCMNIIAGDENTPQGVLIRAAEPLEGLDLIKLNRGNKVGKHLTNGPGKLTAALKIDRTYDCADLCNSEEIFIINDESDYSFEVCTAPRVNIDYAGEYKDKQWRFYIKDNKFVSK